MSENNESHSQVNDTERARRLAEIRSLVAALPFGEGMRIPPELGGGIMVHSMSVYVTRRGVIEGGGNTGVVIDFD